MYRKLWMLLLVPTLCFATLGCGGEESDTDADNTAETAPEGTAEGDAAAE